MDTCGNCDAVTAPGITLCATDTTRLAELLDEIPSALADLHQAVTTRTKGAPQPGGPGGFKSSEPINITALSHSQDIRDMLNGWAGSLGHDNLDATAAALVLRDHLNTIPTHYWAADLLQELAQAVAKARAITQPPTERVRLGQCPTTGCEGTLIATIGSPRARCRACGTTVSAALQHAWMVSEAWHARANLPRVIKAINAHGYVRIPYDRAKKWVQRGDLTPGDDGLFSAAQVMNYYRDSRHGQQELAQVG